MGINIQFALSDFYACENELAQKLFDEYQLDFRTVEAGRSKALDYIKDIRAHNHFGIEQFMYKYNLNSEEGIALMCLAESLLRIPDKEIAHQLAVDKLSNKKWAQYIKGKSALLTKLTALGLFGAGMFANTARVENILTKLVYKIGKTPFLASLRKAIEILSTEFIIGQDIEESIKNAYQNYKKGWNFSFDILGESSRNFQQAELYYDQYLKAIEVINQYFPIEENLYKRPSLSIKLTALHPRLELLKQEQLEHELLPKVRNLVRKCKENNIMISFDAEEAFRLNIYLIVFTNLIQDPEFHNYNGISAVIQAYHKTSHKIIKYLIDLGYKNNKIIPIRLVKGAYWDTEIKNAQVEGLTNYPLFTKKAYTDLSYLASVKLMLEHQDAVYPQFATHNAADAAIITELSHNKHCEFQKLFGMGDSLHQKLLEHYPVRIYAPVGKFDDLLGYLIRRLIENGANSSFVNKVNDFTISNEELAIHTSKLIPQLLTEPSIIKLPKYIYNNRENSMGFELGYEQDKVKIQEGIAKYKEKIYEVSSLIDSQRNFHKKNAQELFAPAHNATKIGELSHTQDSDIKLAVDLAKDGQKNWGKKNVQFRADILRKIADLYEDNKYELYAILIKEAGKTILDAIAEVQEAVDFCRYYANAAEELMQEKILAGPTGERNLLNIHPRGLFVCISPWNFPLAIFTGQIVAALVTGNSVIAKPAGQTPIIAFRATQLMYQAGVPTNVLLLLMTSGSKISELVLKDSRIAGVVFTGSTATAALINRTLTENHSAIKPLIAETGGQNAMVVDSSALMEQVTDDVIISAFHSAGQRCSALRVLYIQEDIYDKQVEMIKGALDALKIGDTIDFANDIGPVIDKNAHQELSEHVINMADKGFKTTAHNEKANPLASGHYFYPHIIEINNIDDVEDEKFGPILHIIKYKISDLDEVIKDINNCGYGLTFGIHSRIEDRINYISQRVDVGNIYINRSMTGAKVESQPFGGEGLSGTGFKAGGPHYLLRFITERATSVNLTAIGGNVELLRLIK